MLSRCGISDCVIHIIGIIWDKLWNYIQRPSRHLASKIALDRCIGPPSDQSGDPIQKQVGTSSIEQASEFLYPKARSQPLWPWILVRREDGAWHNCEEAL